MKTGAMIAALDMLIALPVATQEMSSTEPGAEPGAAK